MNHFLQKESVAIIHGSERAEKAIETAVAALRIIKLQQQGGVATGVSAQA